MSIFRLIPVGVPIPINPRNQAFLCEDRWDDWGKFRTQFRLIIFDENGTRIDPGSVKIGVAGLQPGEAVAPGVRAPNILSSFDKLPIHYFSLGQEETYYEALNESLEWRERVLIGLNDCAYDLTLFEKVRDELVMQESLLRSVPEGNVRSRFHRLANGDATLTKYWFSFRFPAAGGHDESLELSFKIEPASSPPTNVHVLIGRNGVGKSRCMQNIARTICLTDNLSSGVLTQLKDPPRDVFFGEDPDWAFSGLVFVSFSAFDHFILPDLRNAHVKTAVVGLQKIAESSVEPATSTKSREDLLSDFLESFGNCRRGLRAERLRAALTTLGADPLFADSAIASYLNTENEDWESAVRSIFTNLSSGHAVVLLTITRLVEMVEERTLVLLDEPEGHLHPPLLAAFIRSLADLLRKRNGVAIVATHSPVVLQEVPQSCVWKLRRTGTQTAAERPAIETFGENVSVLTREVFGLEVTNSGFHKLLRDAIEVDLLGYEAVLLRFDGQLGAESRAIARALVAERDAQLVGDQ
jgi:hypothetical protein